MKRYKRLLSVLCAVVIALTATVSVNACTTFAVGKDASANGATMVAHTCDGWYDHRIQVVEGGTDAE